MLVQEPAPGAGVSHQVRRRIVDPRCPHCGSDRMQGFGSFRWKDGTRRPRQLCVSCGRTSNPSTGTAVYYIKKRTEWAGQAEGLGEGISLRRMAANLRIGVPTAFRWRHRLMGCLNAHPRERLTGNVLVDHAFVRYSEKGSRKGSGPGSRRVSRQRFRRFIEGKSSFVLLTATDSKLAATAMGQGRPSPEALGACVDDLITPVAARGRLSGQLYSWLSRFHGVATRYLPNYLIWHCSVRRPGRPGPEAIGREMLRLGYRRPPFGMRSHQQFRETKHGDVA